MISISKQLCYIFLLYNFLNVKIGIKCSCFIKMKHFDHPKTDFFSSEFHFVEISNYFPFILFQNNSPPHTPNAQYYMQKGKIWFLPSSTADLISWLEVVTSSIVNLKQMHLCHLCMHLCMSDLFMIVQEGRSSCDSSVCPWFILDLWSFQTAVVAFLGFKQMCSHRIKQKCFFHMKNLIVRF